MVYAKLHVIVKDREVVMGFHEEKKLTCYDNLSEVIPHRGMSLCSNALKIIQLLDRTSLTNDIQ